MPCRAVVAREIVEPDDHATTVRVLRSAANRPAEGCGCGVATRVVEHKRFATREAFDAALAAEIDEFHPRLVVLAGFLRVLTPAFVERYRGRLLNIHPSLLPEFPGTRAIDEALEAGVTTTGVTVHLVDEGLDTGPVLRQESVPVEPRDSLADRIHAVEHRLLPEVVRELCAR